ncbi:hypothetical protein KIN20_008045, partial [Parelaphostrongylus tenuis]
MDHFVPTDRNPSTEKLWMNPGRMSRTGQRIWSCSLWNHLAAFIVGGVVVVVYITLFSPYDTSYTWTPAFMMEQAQINVDARYKCNETSNKSDHRRTHYEPRKDMGLCHPLFGKVTIFVAYVKKSMETHYRVAQQSLECYLKGVNYT